MSYLKDPDASLWYAVDWTAWLTGEGDTAASAVWVVPAGITKAAENLTGGKHNIKLSGGTVGVDYEITSRLTTTGGQVNDRTITVMVRQL